MSDSTTESVNDIIRSIGYISLCFSLFLFLTLKIMKYMLSRKKFHWKITNSTTSTPNSITPMLNSHEIKTYEIKALRGPMVERSFTP